MKDTTYLSGLRLPSGFLRNRIVIPPMASATADEAGFVTERTLAHYRRLATSGAALVFVEYSFVHPSGRSEENQLGVDQEAQVEGLSKLAAVIKASGALAGIQLTHAGGKTERRFTGEEPMGPSGVPVPVKDQIPEIPRPMDLSDIDSWRESFLSAAARARAAGFDVVELHAAHGYGLNQWLSPLTNLRDDAYGGTVEKNLTLITTILREIRASFPELILAVRMPGQDFFPGGLTPQDAVTIARALEASGVEILDVSSGIGGWRRPGVRSGEGYLVEEAGLIQRNVSVPVIGVGGIESKAYVNSILREGTVSLAAIGRAMLKDPEFFFGSG